MLSFDKFDRVNPNKRDVLQRIKDYDEVYEIFDQPKASEQADRCIQCGDPYCHNKCPLHNYIPAWLKQVSQKDFGFAFTLSNEPSPFPEILGKICPHDVLCEGDCTLNDGHGAISIGAIETFINETGFEKGYKPKFPGVSSDKKVAIIGSGPAGISCATFLLRKGVGVTMYEREDRAGGLLTYGIPGFKLDKSKVQRRVDWLVEAGMELVLDCEVGKDISIKEIESQYDAIFVGIGATTPKGLGLDGEDASNVYHAMEFLTNIQKVNFGNSIDKIDVEDKNVVVIGGGDTAMDCVRTSIREKAKSVRCLYRRDEQNMPGSKKEVINAKEEGVEFGFNLSPVSIKTEDGLACGVEVIKTSMGEPDSNGRQKVSDIAGSEYIEEADIVILALGFNPSAPEFLNELGVELNSWKGIEINENFQTSNPKVYSGGDARRGADLAVTAAFDGREAAKNIMENIL
jgi:glutamate synthase (NADPH/NADH) small chain